MTILPDLNKIKQIRKRLDISQKKIEKDLKIPQATISRIENGIGNPSYYTVKKIFDYLEAEETNRKKTEKNASDFMSRKIISIDPKSNIKDAVELMNKFNISQLPILQENKNFGSITAKKIQKTVIDNHELINANIEIIRELPFPEIEEDWDIKNISNLLINYPAVLVKKMINILELLQMQIY